MPAGSTKHAGLEQATAFPGDATQSAAFNKILRIGLLSMGAGVGARTLMGLHDTVDDHFKRRKPVNPAVVAVNVPEAEMEEEAPTLQRSLGPKLGGWEDTGAPGLLDVATRAVAGPEAVGPKSTLGDFFRGRLSADPMSKPWFLPAAVAAGGAGIIGGYKGTDALLGKIKKHRDQQELEKTKEDYRRALIEQYSPESVKQSAQRDELGSDLSELYHLYKQAGGLTDVAGTGVGGYLALAGLLAGGTGLATYNWAKGRSPDERLAKAIKQREQLRWATRPPEIYAVARPSPVRVQSPAQEEDTFAPGSEADKETVRKYAAACKSAAEIAAWYKS